MTTYFSYQTTIHYLKYKVEMRWLDTINDVYSKIPEIEEDTI
jgi:hypothetical protein